MVIVDAFMGELSNFLFCWRPFWNPIWRTIFEKSNDINNFCKHKHIVCHWNCVSKCSRIEIKQFLIAEGGHFEIQDGRHPRTFQRWPSIWKLLWWCHLSLCQVSCWLPKVHNFFSYFFHYNEWTRMQSCSVQELSPIASYLASLYEDVNRCLI